MTRTIPALILLGAILLLPHAAEAQSEPITYFVTDAVGSVRVAMDAAGSITAHYDYIPFGQATATGVTEPRQFAGKERSSNLQAGFDYFGARDYQAPSGVFTTVDPLFVPSNALGDPQLWNRYAYAANNPFRYFDPDGRQVQGTGSIQIGGTCGYETCDMQAFLWAIERWYADVLERRDQINDALTAKFPELRDQPVMGVSPFGPSIRLGAVGRLGFDKLASLARHIPGIARVGAAAGPINGQAALDISVRVSSNSTRRVGIDYATKEFVVFNEHAPGIFHGHVRAWSELNQAMQAALRKAGMVSGKGVILP